MGTHTDTEHRLGSIIERNLSHQVDEMGRFDRPFMKVMNTAAGYERRAKRVRKMAAGGAVAALLVTGFGVSQIDRDKRPGIAMEVSVEPPLRLVPGWMPGGLDGLRLQTTNPQAVSQVSQPDGQLSSSLVSRDGRRQLLQTVDLATVQSWTLSQSGSLIQVEGIQTTNSYLEVEFAGLRPGEVATTIRGLPGFEKTFYPQRIRWKEKGWFITVRGAQAKEGELRKVAESLKAASEAEWERLKLPPFSHGRMTDVDEVASTDITSGQADGGDWTLSAGLRSTANGCINVKIVARDGNVEACMAVNSSDLVMSSRGVTVNGQRMFGSRDGRGRRPSCSRRISDTTGRGRWGRRVGRIGLEMGWCRTDPAATGGRI